MMHTIRFIPKLVRILLMLSVIVACGRQETAPASAPTSSTLAPSSVVRNAPTTAPETAPATRMIKVVDWDSVIAAARGQTVNWYMWGGSESINRFVDDFYGKPLKERYDITLKRVPVADTVDVVNQVLSEKEANKNPGAVDLIWINGENFLTMKREGLLFGPFAGWSPKFLKQGHITDLPGSVKPDNLASMIGVGLTQMSLVNYLIGQPAL